MSITVYGYHPVHGAYTGTTDANASPLEPEVFLDPAFTTRISPPRYSAGEIPVWSGVAWAITPDHRGETWFDAGGTPMLIVMPGNPGEIGLINEPPHTPEPEGPIEPAFPQPRASLNKTDIYSRMSDEELEAFDTAIDAADTRTRLMWRDCLEVMVDSALFLALQAQMAAAFGEGRADAILSLEPA